MNSLIADIAWRPAFSDPYPFAWCITFAHFLAAWLCFSVGRSQKPDNDGRIDLTLRRIWFVIAGLMFALGMNKQLDLQTLLTMYGRELARRDGWYKQRRHFQKLFVYISGSIGISCAVASLFFVRGRRWRQCRVAYLGLIFLVTFVVIRAASLHHIDTFIYHLPLVGNWMNAGLELGGSLLVSLGAWLAYRQNKSLDQLKT